MQPSSSGWLVWSEKKIGDEIIGPFRAAMRMCHVCRCILGTTLLVRPRVWPRDFPKNRCARPPARRVHRGKGSSKGKLVMPLPFHALVPCGACGCHVRLSEKECPHCGALVRDDDGALPRTKVAVLMGLTAALLQPLACGGDVEPRDPSSSSTSAGGTSGDIQV